MNSNQITITKEDGTEEVCEILFTHTSEEFNKNYVVFSVGDSGEVTAMSFVESEDKNQGQLVPVETEAEWDMLESLLEKYADSLEEHEEEHDCSCCAHSHNCNHDSDCDCGE